MYINKHLLHAFAVTGMLAATTMIAHGQRTDRYVLGDPVQGFTSADAGQIVGTADDVLSSAIVPNFYSETGSLDDSIVELVGGEWALKLNTEGSVIEQKLNDAAVSGSGFINKLAEDIYINTRMQFVASEDPPSFTETENAKISLYVDKATSNLVIRHGQPVAIYDGDGPGWGFSPASMGTDVVDTMVECEIDPALWYDVKIVWQSGMLDSGPLVNAFQVYINNVPMTTGAANLALEQGAFADDWFDQLNAGCEFSAPNDEFMAISETGTWFISADCPLGHNPNKLASLGFKGTGALASVSVSEVAPVLFTVVQDPLLVGGTIAFDTTSPVLSNTTVTATATAGQGFVFVSTNAWVVLTADGTPVPFVVDANDPAIITFVVTTNTVVSAPFVAFVGGVWELPIPYTSAKYMDWVKANYPPGNYCDCLNFREAYLLNVNPRTLSNAVVVVTSFSASPLSGTWAVSYNTTSDSAYQTFSASDLAAMNGTSVVLGAATLAGPWNPVNVIFQTNGTFIIDPLEAAGKVFFKVAVTDEEEFPLFF